MGECVPGASDLERWFTPWRGEYVTASPDDEVCLLCRLPRSTSDRDALVLARGAAVYVLINRYPYNSGHVMVVPYRHCASLAEMSREERAELLDWAARCEAALRQAYRPEGMNMGLNLGKSAGAGIADHLHLHVLPRWSGDTNFMTALGETRVIPEDLDATWRRLRPLLGTEGEPEA